MTPDDLGSALADALASAVASGELPDPGPVQVSVRARDSHQWASPLALRIAAATGMPVSQVASVLADRLAPLPGIETVAVRDGFLEVTFRSPDAAVERALAEGPAYGRLPEVVLGPPSRWVAAAQSRRRTRDNPVFAVQWVRARLAAAEDEHVDVGPRRYPDTVAPQADPALVGAVGEFPSVVRKSVGTGDPEIVARFLEAVVHQVDEATDLPADLRCALTIVLGNGLEFLGTATPARV